MRDLNEIMAAIKDLSHPARVSGESGEQAMISVLDAAILIGEAWETGMALAFEQAEELTKESE